MTGLLAWSLHVKATGSGGFILCVNVQDANGDTREDLWVRENVERAIADISVRLRALITPPN
jgi:hypothetical protein